MRSASSALPLSFSARPPPEPVPGGLHRPESAPLPRPKGGDGLVVPLQAVEPVGVAEDRLLARPVVRRKPQLAERRRRPRDVAFVLQDPRRLVARPLRVPVARVAGRHREEPLPRLRQLPGLPVDARLQVLHVRAEGGQPVLEPLRQEVGRLRGGPLLPEELRIVEDHDVVLVGRREAVQRVVVHRPRPLRVPRAGCGSAQLRVEADGKVEGRQQPLLPPAPQPLVRKRRRRLGGVRREVVEVELRRPGVRPVLLRQKGRDEPFLRLPVAAAHPSSGNVEGRPREPQVVVEGRRVADLVPHVRDQRGARVLRLEQVHEFRRLDALLPARRGHPGKIQDIIAQVVLAVGDPRECRARLREALVVQVGPPLAEGVVVDVRGGGVRRSAERKEKDRRGYEERGRAFQRL